METTPGKSFTRVAIAIIIAALVISASFVFSYSAFGTTLTKTLTSDRTTTLTQLDTTTVTSTTTATTTRTILDTPESTTIISPSGLGLEVDLNSTSISYGGTVAARLILFNALNQNLTLIPDYQSNSTIQKWNGYDFFCGGSIFSSIIGYALFQGDYASTNISLAADPLQLSPPVNLSCVTYANPSSVVFLPNTDTVVFYPPGEGNPNREEVSIAIGTESCTLNSAGAYLCGLGAGFSGYWNSSSPITEQDAMIGSKYFSYLSLGEYTLAVQDMWNQTVYVHFNVIRSPISVPLYNVTFEQTGACSPPVYTIPWSVTLGSETKAEPPNTPLPIPDGGTYTAGPEPANLYTIVFTSMPDGVYQYKIAPSGPFTITSGTVTVNGTDVSVPVYGPVVSCRTTTSG